MGTFSEISAVLSLGTNVLATILVGVKAWYVLRSFLHGCMEVHFRARQHRSMMCGRSGDKRKARVAKAFLLLLESGTIYSVLLVRLCLRYAA